LAVTPEAPEGFINLRRISSAGHKKDVYAAFHTLTRSWKVLKVFKETPSEKALAEDLRPLLSSLQHENIVRLETPQIIRGNVWIIEEQLDGTFQDLTPMIDRHSFAVLSLHIAKGLEYLHTFQHGHIVHGDIHLRNCGVSNGVGKLLDFGQATYDDPQHPRSGHRGYICTRSPEQFTEPPQGASIRQDVWAFGCTLYALRAGEYPFISSDELDQYRQSADDASSRELERTVAERAREGLGGSFASRHRYLFDDRVWEILSSAIHPDAASRPTSSQLVAEFRGYSEANEDLRGEAEVAPSAMFEHAREMLEEGRIARLPWFEEKVRARNGGSSASG
jgi:serine/threonine protein kinase